MGLVSLRSSNATIVRHVRASGTTIRAPAMDKDTECHAASGQLGQECDLHARALSPYLCHTQRIHHKQFGRMRVTKRGTKRLWTVPFCSELHQQSSACPLLRSEGASIHVAENTLQLVRSLSDLRGNQKECLLSFLLDLLEHSRTRINCHLPFGCGRAPPRCRG